MHDCSLAIFHEFEASETSRCPVFDLLKWFLAFRTFGSVLKAVVSQINRRRQTRTVKNFRLRKHSAHSCLRDTQLQLTVNVTPFVPCFFLLNPFFSKDYTMSLSSASFQTPPSPQRRRHTPPLLPVKLQISPLETAAVAPSGPAVNEKADASPRVGPLLGGVVRSDDLRLGHHSVLILREGVAVCEHNEYYYILYNTNKCCTDQIHIKTQI